MTTTCRKKFWNSRTKLELELQDHTPGCLLRGSKFYIILFPHSRKRKKCQSRSRQYLCLLCVRVRVRVCGFNFQQHHGDGQFGGDSNRGTDAIMGRVQRVLGSRTICDVARRCPASGNYAEGQWQIVVDDKSWIKRTTTRWYTPNTIEDSEQRGVRRRRSSYSNK